jgi:hypothetical protein
MTVEITPAPGTASRVAAELLAIAADLGLRVEDIATTTAGPMGLAFLVPDAIHEAWAADTPAAAAAPAPRRRRTAAAKEDS